MTTIFIERLANTPLDDVWVAVRHQKLVAVTIGRSQGQFRKQIRALLGDVTVDVNSAETAPFINQIRAYFKGDQLDFDLPIDWELMQSFQIKALKLVLAIPAGSTRSYGDIARDLGDITLSRAVGTANATNPMPLIIPCHRVLGSDGKLHGYSGAKGLETKEWLLHHEGAIQARQMRLF